MPRLTMPELEAELEDNDLARAMDKGRNGLATLAGMMGMVPPTTTTQVIITSSAGHQTRRAWPA